MQLKGFSYISFCSSTIQLPSDWRENALASVVLCYKREPLSNGRLCYLAQFECNSETHSDYQLHLPGGKIDLEDASPFHAAQRELKEEAGLSIPEDNFIYLGSVHPSKGRPGLVYVFAADCTGHQSLKPETDGTLGEALSYRSWVSPDKLLTSSNPVVFYAYLKHLQSLDKSILNRIECVPLM